LHLRRAGDPVLPSSLLPLLSLTHALLRPTIIHRLGAVAVHPNFAENRWIYLFYTYNRGSTGCLLDPVVGPVNRCSRFAMNDDWTVDVQSELILFQTLPLADKMHNGGDMEFGVDGMLYIVTGDAGGRSLQLAQDRSNLFGSVLRLTDSGEIPYDNPFTGDGTVRCHETGNNSNGLICREIYAYGLRNPFRFVMDPHSTDKVRYLISDVGGKVWEEISVGGEDQIGANYGWPILEGPCDYNSVTECSIGDSAQSEFTDPLYWYQHDRNESGCAVGVTIPPPGLNWPAPYNNPSSFFFVDYVWGNFYHITENLNMFCSTCSPPHHGFRNETFHQWPRPVGLKFGPYVDHSGSSNATAVQSALYYTAREGRINIRRIVYRGGNNFSPTVVMTVDKMNVPVGGVIVFNASQTTDPNHSNNELSFTWDFGDGSPEAMGMVVSHQYDAVGLYEVTLTVVDPDGARGLALEEVSVGAGPTVMILSPAEGTTFAVGDVFTLVGIGTDHAGNPLNESTQLSWEVRQHHNNHYHPFLEEGTVGNYITITEAPAPEDFLSAASSYLEILLTGTDSQGISTTVSRMVMPKTVNLDFDTNPMGLELSLDDQVLTMPQRVLSWENHHLRVVAPDQGNYVFSSWSNLAAASNELYLIVPANNSEVPLFVASFTSAATGSPTAAPVPALTTESPLPPPTDAPTFLIVVTIEPTASPTDPKVTADTSRTESDDKPGGLSLDYGRSSSNASFSSLWNLLLLSMSSLYIGHRVLGT